MTDVDLDRRIRDALVDANIAEEKAIDALMEAERGFFQRGDVQAQESVRQDLLLLRAIQRSGHPVQEVLSKVDSKPLWDELARRNVLKAPWDDSLETCAIHCQREELEGGG